jgi:hypothetical protein
MTQIEMILDKISAIESRLSKLEGPKHGDGIVSEMQQYERVDHAKEMADKILDDVSGMDNRSLAIMQAEIHLSSVSSSEGINFWTRVIKYIEML